ncbi:hypothetical protein BUALT_Bualt09G0108900 [Buddleja alternifolia]|uniref:Photosystem I reaction center subunit VIII n=1 Tax=Buddleja alternifolia TaxID=168488 RepID=A0AAV6X3A3_9LAMI|nr:hypothetical protein BUALT_Bualt09G0108900 [Buddleja alternifolia]
MRFSFLNSLLQRIPHPRGSLLLYAATWTTILTVTVAVASFSSELAFLSAISPGSSSCQACRKAGSVRLPLDIPSEAFCIPDRLIKRSRIDVIVPPVFATVIVAGSACLVKAFGLWEADDEQF